MNKDIFFCLFNSINDYAYIVNHQFLIEHQNSNAVKRFKLNIDSGLFSILSIFSENDQNYLQRHIQNGQISEKYFETNVSLSNSPKTKMKLRINRIGWPNNDSYLIILKDISITKGLSLKKQNDFETWFQVLESVSDGFIDWNLQNSNVYFSEKWKNTVGANHSHKSNSIEEWHNRIHPEDKDRITSSLNDYFQNKKEAFTEEHRLQCFDNSYKWIIVQGKIVNRNSDNEPVNIIITFTDISKQKEFQNSLTNSLVKQKDLNELKTRFVSMASHEFRTPLATILLSIETLESYWKRMPEEDFVKKMAKIKTNVIFLKNIIEKVLSLTHLESGKLKVKLGTTEIIRFLKIIVQEYYDFKNVKQKVIFEPKYKEVYINLDKQIIEQVIKNLISNCIKYSPNDSSIKIDLNVSDEFLTITIKDEGIGIPPEDMKNLFNPFFRARNVGNIRGTGLGLSLTKEFVQLHNGHIKAQSILGKGTEFSFTLPGIEKINLS